MPGAHYTNQCSYSTRGEGRAEPHPLGVFAPSRLCVEPLRTHPDKTGSFRNSSGPEIGATTRDLELGASLVIGTWFLGLCPILSSSI